MVTMTATKSRKMSVLLSVLPFVTPFATLMLCTVSSSLSYYVDTAVPVLMCHKVNPLWQK